MVAALAAAASASYRDSRSSVALAGAPMMHSSSGFNTQSHTNFTTTPFHTSRRSRNSATPAAAAACVACRQHDSRLAAMRSCREGERGMRQAAEQHDVNTTYTNAYTNA